MYYRLIEETDTEIHLSTEGMEIPGIECVKVEYHKVFKSFIETLVQTHTITFENGRIVKANIIKSGFAAWLSKNHTEFIFEKCLTTD